MYQISQQIRGRRGQRTGQRILIARLVEQHGRGILEFYRITLTCRLFGEIPIRQGHIPGARTAVFRSFRIGGAQSLLEEIQLGTMPLQENILPMLALTR